MSTPPLPGPVPFRVAIAPAWKALLPRVAARAAQIGVAWPAAVAVHRVGAVYSLTLRGDAAVETPDITVVTWAPPHEATLPAVPLPKLDVGFGVGPRRGLLAAGAGAGAISALEVRVDAGGMYFAGAAPGDGGGARVELAALPVAAVLQHFRQVAARQVAMVRVDSDHIVDRYQAVPGLEGFVVSRWRGDAFFRLAHSLVRVEVEVGRG